ncbi:MAG: Hint domain-containing protein [Pseudomonadota bacterium]
MADYTIYVLDETDVSIALPKALDGQTQGDGSHLNGQTMTITSSDWTQINIRDNDVNFSDNDKSQRLDGDQEINGVTYDDNRIVEAEFSFEASYVDDDGVTQTWTLVAFNVREPDGEYSNIYGSIEGIAVIGGSGDFPPTGVPLTLSNAKEGPSFAADDYATPICFDSGALIRTPNGYVPVEELRTGDLVTTLDGGVEPILWIGARRAFGAGAFAPVEIAAGILGNEVSVRLSQQHRLLINGPQAELFFGEPEVLVSARSLLGQHGITLREGVQVNYHHMLLPSHAVLDCAGLRAESLLPSDYGLSQLPFASQREVLSLMQSSKTSAYTPARRILRSYEARTLLAA